MRLWQPTEIFLLKVQNVSLILETLWICNFLIFVFQESSRSYRGIQFWPCWWKFSAKIPKDNRSMPKKTKISVPLYLFNKISKFSSGNLQIFFPGSLTLWKPSAKSLETFCSESKKFLKFRNVFGKKVFKLFFWTCRNQFWHCCQTISTEKTRVFCSRYEKFRNFQHHFENFSSKCFSDHVKRYFGIQLNTLCSNSNCSCYIKKFDELINFQKKFSERTHWRRSIPFWQRFRFFSAKSSQKILVKERKDLNIVQFFLKNVLQLFQ